MIEKVCTRCWELDDDCECVQCPKCHMWNCWTCDDGFTLPIEEI